MKQTLKTIIRNVKSINGNSLAEFATTTALMATLAATAAPKLSEMSEGTKAEKSMNEIDKILTQARNFYQTTADTEGRGRFPGQDKFDVKVGDYGSARNTDAAAALSAAVTAQNALLTDLGNMNVWDHATGAKWRSVFGISNTTKDAAQDAGGKVSNDIQRPCGTCPGTNLGHVDWLELFAGNTLVSKYQDGHFAYAVVPGGGSGTDAFPPVMYVVDIRSPQDAGAFFFV
jgi:hypothetical protein